MPQCDLGHVRASKRSLPEFSAPHAVILDEILDSARSGKQTTVTLSAKDWPVRLGPFGRSRPFLFAVSLVTLLGTRRKPLFHYEILGKGKPPAHLSKERVQQLQVPVSVRRRSRSRARGRTH